MKCTECGTDEEMKKVIDEAMGTSFECLACGHTIDVFYASKKDNLT